MSGNKPQEYKSPYMEVRPAKAERRCLKCQRAFNSTGPGNRICLECARNNVHAYRRDVVATEGCSSRFSKLEGDR